MTKVDTPNKPPINMATNGKNKGGAPKGSINAIKTGARLGTRGTGITRLTMGELPSAMRRQLSGARKYRRGLETLVVDAKGEVNATDAHLIDEAAAAEIHASVCRWLLRTRLEKMTVSDVSRCSEQILKAKTIRNRAVERLELNVKPDPWNTMYTEALQAPSPEASDDAEDEEALPTPE